MKKSLLKNFSRTLLVLACCLVSTNAWATSMWILGDPAGGWAPNNGVQMNQSSDNQFWKILYMENGWNFSFTSSLAPDWGSMAGGRLCPFDNDFPIHDGNYTCSGYGQNTDKSFDMDGESGYYVITINSTSHEMTIHPAVFVVAGKSGTNDDTESYDPIFGTPWAPSIENVNDMTPVNAEHTKYIKTYTNKELDYGTLPYGNIAFKVCLGHSWDISYPSGDWYLPTVGTGTYDVIVTFNYGAENPVGGVAAAHVSSLKDLCTNGKNSGDYVIKEALLGVYKKVNDNGTTSVWFKDDNNAIDKQTPGSDTQNFEINNENGNKTNTEGFDQSNWIEVVFPEGLLPENPEFNNAEPMVKITNLTGRYFTEGGNPTFVVAVKPAETDVEALTGSAYVPNPYIPAHFGTVNGGYFFSKPKAQEYAYITLAAWDGQVMNVPTTMTETYGFTGSFSIVADSETLSALQEYTEENGSTYSFHAIIRKAGSASSAPRLKVNGEEYEVRPTDLTSTTLPTAISTIETSNGEVKSVKYVSVAGVVSDRPFQGVNIVVTEYTDGSRTTAKVVK